MKILCILFQIITTIRFFFVVKPYKKQIAHVLQYSRGGVVQITILVLFLLMIGPMYP
jgi:hypothetical protein